MPLTVHRHGAVMKAADFFGLPDDQYWQELSRMAQPTDIKPLCINGHVEIALAEAEKELASAAAKHQAGEHRFAFMLAAQAALRVFVSAGTSFEQQEIYRHLWRVLGGGRSRFCRAVPQAINGRK